MPTSLVKQEPLPRPLLMTPLGLHSRLRLGGSHGPVALEEQL